MLIRYFKSSFPGQFVTIGVAGLLLWGAGALNPPLMPPPDGPVPLYEILYSWVSGFPYLAMAIGFLLVVFLAVWLNYIVSNHNLVPHNTSLAALLFLLFVSLFPSWMTLTPVNITLLFFLFIVRALLESYNQGEPIELVYIAGFFVGLSSFFYLPSLLLYGFLLTCFLVYRSLHWREWISSLLGLATPFLYLVVVYFLTDRFSRLIAMYGAFFRQITLITPDLSWNNWTLYGLMGLLALVGLWNTFLHLGEKTVELRKKNLLLIWLLIWVALMIPYTHTLHLYHPGLLSICLAVFVTNFYMHLRKPARFEWLLWLLFLSILANIRLIPILFLS
ncbi:MAG: hypothetical protein D4R67_10035 [Bacteroidetes bacterium]|nr:MAG: hypothetical protein D4R67_10035 [Bacteroidota bacterium]